ncbi:endonuclease domain-containing protein [Kumtagia ephedrae]|uniref:Endonuclease domain-containing protein n=1 Tax=Kumtagia ephedrae TaxID=2116701 RepID=A0A2P7SDK7_9HYPH|nr:DUF559 domain-containing protein [Mesorhizobium ephedrae]PSJ60557.1 endonuclease domain-containing protein [Mesorhizobium ephedrae]
MPDKDRSRRKHSTTDRARSLRKGDNIAEARLWMELKDRRLGGHKFVRQFPIGPNYADFLCRKARLVIEVDGSQHADSVTDRGRDEFMRAEGYFILRFWNIDVLKQIGPVCETILAALEGRYAEDVVATDLRYIHAPVSHRE